MGENKYYNYLIGYNSRLDALQAAILRKKLTHLEEFVDKRRKNAATYNNEFRDTGYTIPVEGKDSHHSYYIYALKHDNAKGIMKRLKDAGVACGTYYPVSATLARGFCTFRVYDGGFAGN